jgi:ATP synthase protein I
MTEPEERRRDEEHSTADAMRSFGLVGSIGIAFVLSIVIGAGIGLLVDRWIGRGHWGFFLFLLLGIAAGVVSVYRVTKSLK